MSAAIHLEMPAILDVLATPVLLIDADGCVRYANPAFSAWTVTSARRVVGLPLAAIAPDLLALFARADAVAGGAPGRAQRIRVALHPGDERYAHALLTTLDAEHAPMRHVLEFHPVDEFSGADPAVAMPSALHEALKGLAHEVRNPLAGLRGAAQLLARRVDDVDAKRYLEVITAETDRLTDLVEKLLHPKPPRPFEPVNVHEVLERVRLLAESDAGWAAVIQRDYDPSLPTLPGDADRLTQAIWNLVRNALQAAASEIRLRTRAEHGVVIGERACKLALRIEVIDNGCGVPEDLATRLFLPLVSGRADGTGLGLTLAQHIAREHGGSLSYRSRPGHTVFALLLPAEDAHA